MKRKPENMIGVEIAIGVAFGVAIGNVGLGIALGVAIGAAMHTKQKNKIKLSDSSSGEKWKKLVSQRTSPNCEAFCLWDDG